MAVVEVACFNLPTDSNLWVYEFILNGKLRRSQSY